MHRLGTHYRQSLLHMCVTGPPWLRPFQKRSGSQVKWVCGCPQVHGNRPRPHQFDSYVPNVCNSMQSSLILCSRWSMLTSPALCSHSKPVVYILKSCDDLYSSRQMRCLTPQVNNSMRCLHPSYINCPVSQCKVIEVARVYIEDDEKHALKSNQSHMHGFTQNKRRKRAMY